MNCIWHTDLLSTFVARLYKDVLTTENIVTDEVTKKYNDEEWYGYVLVRTDPETKLKEKFFVRTDDIDQLPFLVQNHIKFSYKNEVFKFVTKVSTVKIPARNMMTFKEMVDFYAGYGHSNPDHWKLARIIILAAYIERLNIRIVSEASFGKDALVDILSILNGKVSNLYNATLAKLKFGLNNDLVIINELGGLKKEEVGNLQIYLTQAGSYKPVYENNSRATAGVKETMDLKNKSHVIYHNTPDYYTNKGQQYFEQMFTPAIMDRFPALLMQGYVKEDFSRAMNITELTPTNEKKIKDFISTLNYYKQSIPTKPVYRRPDYEWGFNGKEMQRSLRSFTIIAKYISEYSQTQDEFDKWADLLVSCRDKYKDIISQLHDTVKYTEEEWIK